MSVCPNCGAPNSGKFCENCGAALPVEQPVEQAQPAQQIPPAQPVQPVQTAQQIPPAQPVQPIQTSQQSQPVQPVYQVPVQPVYQQQVQPQPQPVMEPVYQQPVYAQNGQNYQTQPAAPAKPKTNGLCIAGFILGLVGFITLGLTSFLGLLLSVVGVIVAGVKKQKGKVLGIIGIILSLLLVIVWIVVIVNIGNFFQTLDKDMDGRSFEEWLFDDSYSGKIEIISETDWVETHDGSYLVFEDGDNFKYYKDYRVTDNYYYTGTYEITFGVEAIDLITEKYTEYGYTEDDITNMIAADRGIPGMSEFVVLVLNNDGCWIDGVNTEDFKWKTVYMGYYYADENELDLINLDANTDFYFVPFYSFDESSIVMPDLEPTTVTVADEDHMGDSLTGTVYLYQGEWEDWYEADGMDSYYLSRIQKFNSETGSIIQLSVFTGEYSPDDVEEIVEAVKDNMEEEGCAVSEIEETTIGGYTAYTVTGQFQDGEYLTVWYFVDDDYYLHYISVEYYEDDIDSYYMVTDTYSFEG